MSAQNIIAGIVTFTAVTSYVNYRFIKLPKSIGLTLITFIIALSLKMVAMFYPNVINDTLKLTQKLDFNQTLLHGMIGFLLFAGALQINVRDLLAHKWLISILSTVSVAISAILIGTTTWCIAQIFNYNLPLAYALMFGALISPTDPIAVLAILNKSSVSKSLKIKFAGEAMFNDGVGIVLFIGFSGLLNNQIVDLHISELLIYFIRETLGGVVAGYVLARLVMSLLKTISQFEQAFLITLALVTGGYYLMDVILDVSGVISIAIAGLYIGAKLHEIPMPRSEIEKLKEVWTIIDEILNALLFVLIGLVFLSLSFNSEIIIMCLGIIAMVIVSRWISIALPVSLVPRLRKNNPLTAIWLLSWGGLRGGVSIALALSIAPTDEAELVLAITYGVVLFSLAVQGLTIGPLVRQLAPSTE